MIRLLRKKFKTCAAVGYEGAELIGYRGVLFDTDELDDLGRLCKQEK